MGALARSLERFLLPNTCVACERPVATSTPDALVCTLCVSRLEPVAGGCDRCRQPLPPVGPCRFCAEWPSHLATVRSAVWLGTEARAIVHHLKYEGYTAVAPEVARIVDRHVGTFGAGTLVPIPLSNRRKRDRGYNQSAVIARALAARWRLPLLERLVRRTRETRSQTTLTPDERRGNVTGAFAAAAPPAPQGRAGRAAAPIILIDDVLTTGATLVAAAEALQAVGWPVIHAITFARALPFARRVRDQ